MLFFVYQVRATHHKGQIKVEQKKTSRTVFTTKDADPDLPDDYVWISTYSGGECGHQCGCLIKMLIEPLWLLLLLLLMVMLMAPVDVANNANKKGRKKGVLKGTQWW